MSGREDAAPLSAHLKTPFLFEPYKETIFEKHSHTLYRSISSLFFLETLNFLRCFTNNWVKRGNKALFYTTNAARRPPVQEHRFFLLLFDAVHLILCGARWCTFFTHLLVSSIIG